MLDDNLKKTMKCMMIGVLIYDLILIVISIIAIYIYYNGNENLLFNILKNEICVLIGFLLSVFWIYSMTTSLDKAINANDENFAKRHIIVNAVLRLAIFCIIFIFIINEKIFGFTGGIMFALAVFGIKISAYITPIIEKKIK